MPSLNKSIGKDASIRIHSNDEDFFGFYPEALPEHISVRRL